MTKIIEGNLILDKDTVFDESLEVHGSILGKDGNRYNLTVNGNIKAEDITAWDIDAGNISAWDISARNIDAKNINARNITTRNINAINISAWSINADFIICDKLVQKPDSTLTVRKVINNRSTYNRSTIDNSQFIKQEESIKQEKCNACGQVLRGKEQDKLSEKLK